jgi:hypothetical protein
MQTFLPYGSYIASAEVLDRQRLGKQRVEVLQLLRALLGIKPGWVNHPAAVMWRGHEWSLAGYGLKICWEWQARGYRDTCAEQIAELQARVPHPGLSLALGCPPWLGDPDFHRSHQSNLIRKLPEHYGPMWPDVPPDLPYVWPVTAGKE